MDPSEAAGSPVGAAQAAPAASAIPQLAADSVQTGFLAHLGGLRLHELSGDRVLATFTAGPELHQPYGLVHGGVYCSVIETLASLGGQAWLSEQLSSHAEHGQVVGVNNHTDFLRAVREGELTALGTPVHRGRSQQLWLVEIRDADDRLIARGQVRLQNIAASDGLGRPAAGAH